MTTALPAKYSEKTAPYILPESPFIAMASDHVCVKADGFTYSGMLTIPESAKRSSTTGRVIDCAPGIHIQGYELKRGDRILYSQFAGYMFIFKELKDMRVMDASEVLGLVRDEVEVVDE